MNTLLIVNPATKLAATLTKQQQQQQQQNTLSLRIRHPLTSKPAVRLCPQFLCCVGNDNTE